MATELTPIMLTDEQVLEVSALPGTFEYDEKTEMKGQWYRRFKYNNTVFVVNTDHEFCKFYDEERLAMVKLVPVPDKKDPAVIRLQLDTAVSQERLLKNDEFKAKRKFIHSKYDPTKVDESLFASLSNPKE